MLKSRTTKILTIFATILSAVTVATGVSFASAHNGPVVAGWGFGDANHVHTGPQGKSPNPCDTNNDTPRCCVKAGNTPASCCRNPEHSLASRCCNVPNSKVSEKAKCCNTSNGDNNVAGNKCCDTTSQSGCKCDGDGDQDDQNCCTTNQSNNECCTTNQSNNDNDCDDDDNGGNNTNTTNPSAVRHDD
jgi:hypothetical protein